LKPNRTPKDIYFENRNPKPNLFPAVDDENKNFLTSSKQSRKIFKYSGKV